MKVLKSVFIIAGAFLFFNACEEPVKFSEPQPAGLNNLQNFPRQLNGLYKSINDNYSIEICSKWILMNSSRDVAYSKSEVEQSNEIFLNGDVIIDKQNNIAIKVKLVNDTLKGTINETDTLFKLAGDNVLRKFRGHYFINTKNEDGSFGVQMLSYRQGEKLVLSSIEKNETDNLKAITAIEEPDDSTFTSDYQFSPTKKEFKKFIKDMHGFRDQQEFIKIN